MKTRVFWARFFLVAALATAVMIFCFSAQQGPESAELSEGVTKEVAKVVKPNYKILPPAAQRSFLMQLGAVVRKCAHFGEFALLGFNIMAWLCLSRPDKSPAASAPPAWLAATLYAGTDELHQMFVNARGPALLDVGIDSGGALTGVLAALAGAALLAWFRQAAARRCAASGELL